MAQPWSDPRRDIIGEIWEAWQREYESWLFPPDHPSGPRAVHNRDSAYPYGTADHWPADQYQGYLGPEEEISWPADQPKTAFEACPSDFLPELSWASRTPSSLERAVLADRHRVLRRNFIK